MTLQYGDRVQEIFTTTGTGTLSLGGAVVGYQAFSGVCSNADTCYYSATDESNWEVGVGTYTSSGNTLARTTILASSNGNAAVNWVAGTKNIWLTLPAAQVSQSFLGMRNRTINGDMRVDQRNAGASQTITAAAAAAYTVDRFHAACTGANVTGQRVAGTTFDQYMYQLTGAASVTAIAFGQRYAAANVYDLASTTATFSVELSNSLLTTVTWAAYIPASADTWTSRTQIVTGTFTVSPTKAKYATQIALPSTVTTGLEIELSVGAQISGTFVIGQWQLEGGLITTPFERRPLEMETPLCLAYYEVLTGGRLVSAAVTSVGQFISWQFKARKRILPVVTQVGSTISSVDNTCVDSITVVGSTSTAVVIGAGTNANSEL